MSFSMAVWTDVRCLEGLWCEAAHQPQSTTAATEQQGTNHCMETLRLNQRNWEQKVTGPQGQGQTCHF